ncbi:TIGR00730 family Rossman fold protein [Vandammella animalimorsus]|uniref:Cytokinin riboside 5'-monophosphate phosphoribohydrolase n=1 Tax=Vandammella animalimorsus TaxID=2029117 RepID=A0A2A2A7V1_9BURK|nr:TIGR00730 family Rossman fold protein [Vandammella animalimorsus]PAT33818.1 TIGR00730 family Rossman fold protein [Vandammella animalimorsus]
MQPRFSFCVYCGSRNGSNPRIIEAAQAVGRWIGEQGGQLVYGGGKSGLMGLVAQAAKEAGARVVGIIPTVLVHKEMANEACDELFVVDTMHQRKAMMAQRSDAFVALPGGIGTFEELFEIWTWRQLGYHDKPIGILDVDGYYSALQPFLQHCIANGLLSDWQMTLTTTSNNTQALLHELLRQLQQGPQASAPLNAQAGNARAAAGLLGR